MYVSGDLAKDFMAVDLSSLAAVPGTLIECDDQLGLVRVADKTGAIKEMNFGPRRIRLIPHHHVCG